jgi:DNA-binding MarR family transcriptional regulator/uncharacterized protein YbcV (DUF1398 family)
MKKHDLKDDIGYWLNRLRMQVHQGFESRLEVYDVTIAQWCILLSLYNESAASITELSKFIEVDKATISRVVDRLLVKELIIHQPGADRRSGHIQLTIKGQALVPQLVQEAEENEQQFFSCLTEEEQELFRQLFHKLFLNMPSIHMSGWLFNTRRTQMFDKKAIDMIEQGIQENFKRNKPFPEWVATLKDAGIERYYADLVALQVTYYSTDHAHTAKLPYLNPPTRGEIFSEDELVGAIRASQRGEILYPEFLNRAIKAGVVSYTVYLSGKQVQYMGEKGEIHIEHFPR